MRTLQGWIGGLGGAVAITAGVVIAALMVTAVVAFHGGASKVKVPGGVGKVTLAQNGQNSGASGSAAKRTGTAKASSSPQRGARTRGSRAGSGVGRSFGGDQRRQRIGGGNPHAPVPQSPKHTDSPSTQGPGSASPTTGSSPSTGGGGGGTTTTPRSSTPVGDTVRNTTDALGDTVGGATQTVGDTVGTVSPALGNTVDQVAPVLDNTVKNSGDAVGGALDGLLGAHH